MLHWQAREAGESRQQLVQSRINYDRSLKETLGDAGYERYRALETRKRIETSVQALKSLASESGVALWESGSKAAADLTVKYVGSVRLDERWNGPYDPLPRPTGGVSGAEELRRDLIVLESGATQLLAEASGLLTEDELSVLKRLIDKKVEEITYGFRAFTRTREEQQAARDAILGEPSRKGPARSPGDWCTDRDPAHEAFHRRRRDSEMGLAARDTRRRKRRGVKTIPPVKSKWRRGRDSNPR